MKINSRGQVTIPAELRRRYGLVEGNELEIVGEGDSLRIIPHGDSESRGSRTVRRMRNKATTTMTTDEILELTRGE